MSTLNGIGTRYISWQHQQDGTSFATLWFCVFYLPVIPLKRHHLQILNGIDEEKAVGIKESLIAVSPHKQIVDRYSILNETKLIKTEIVKTYLFSYCINPLIISAPFIILVIVNSYLKDSEKGGNWYFWFITIYILISFGFSMAYTAIIFHRSRGGVR